MVKDRKERICHTVLIRKLENDGVQNVKKRTAMRALWQVCSEEVTCSSTLALLVQWGNTDVCGGTSVKKTSVARLHYIGSRHKRLIVDSNLETLYQTVCKRQLALLNKTRCIV